MEKILIIDDDIELTSLFKDYLEQEHYDIDVAHDGISGLEKAQRNHYDIIILDVMLPKMSGTELLIKLRHSSNVPILMFTAKDDDLDRIIGLESGADDYVTKPCTPRELVARIRAILRRANQTSTDDSSTSSAELHIGPLRISSETRRATWFDEELNLTSSEFSVLETLAKNAGHVVSKNELCELALSRQLTRFDRSIDVHISSIRQKLGNQDDGHTYIQTIRGKGYQFIKGEL